jgi:hypothetical protein
MHGGLDECAGKEKVIQREEAHVGERERHYQLRRDIEAQRAGDQQRAQQQSGAGEDHGGRIQVTGARHGQIAADHQSPQGELKESLDRSRGSRR